jgi:mannosyltransferase
VVVLLVGFALRAWAIAYPDLTFDEVATVFIAQRPPLEILRYLTGAIREHPPAYYLLMSPWLDVAGRSEFVVRYPSALAGILTIAVAARFGRRLLGREGGWWAGLLLAVLPFAVWTGQTARMYSLVLLLALATMETWWQLQDPTPQRWSLFIVLSLVGAMTHYYLALLWLVEALLLLLFRREYREARWRWLAIAVVVALLLSALVVTSPGLQSTLRETGRRFPVRYLRVTELLEALMDLYLWWHYPTLLPVTLAGLLVTLLGWLLLFRRSRMAGTLLALWGLLPLLVIVFIPEAIEARYLTPVFPALALGLAATITLLRPHLLRLALAVIVLYQAVLHWDRLFLPPNRDFSEQMAFLHTFARPGDALIFNGPWPELLTHYYAEPEYLTVYKVPLEAPPGFDPEIDIHRLEYIGATHARLWVSYGAVEPADPRFGVSGWLAEQRYMADRFHDLALYLPAPGELITVKERVAFGDALELTKAAVDSSEVRQGETLRVHLTWRGEPLTWQQRVTLALLGPNGEVWTKESNALGPIFQNLNQELASPWKERRGLWIRPGIPPGDYTLALGVRGEGVQAAESEIDGWLHLTEVRVKSSRRTPLERPRHTIFLPLVVRSTDEVKSPQERYPKLPYPDWYPASATFGEQLEILGLRAEDEVVTQGYVLEFDLLWQLHAPTEKAQVYVQLLGPRRGPVQTYDMAPDFYPITEWQVGEMVQQSVRYPLPRDLPGGRYHVQVQLRADGEQPLPVGGSRPSETLLEYLTDGRDLTLEGKWADLFVIDVEERERRFRPPLFRTRADATFGEVLRLRGYRIESTEVHAGEEIELTEYWQAIADPDRTYAVFNHLIGAGGRVLWQQDSWPQAGRYTTRQWLEGEVVPERYSVTIPEDAPPGEYTLYVGTYSPREPDVRLPASDAQGERYLNDAVPLLTLEVLP